jgi:plastocyanin
LLGVPLAALAAVTLSPAAAAQSAPPSPAPTPEPIGIYLDPEEIAELGAAFGDEPLTGGQVAPRISRFVTPETFLFLQFDDPDLAQATALRYVGIGVTGVFCAEAQPDRSFTHFHRYEADEYANGHGGDPGAQGYWLSWLAADSFEARDGRLIVPGIDYEFSPTPSPSCGADVPTPDFDPADADALTAEETQELMSLFGDSFLTGGQSEPRAGRWVNDEVFMFLQGDEAPNESTTVRYIGIGANGVFCAETQPSSDFTHYHRVHAAAYREGHAGDPGVDEGYWLLWVATQPFEAQDRQVGVGVDRDFSPTPPPACGEVPQPSPSALGQTTSVEATEWRFTPAELSVPTGQPLRIQVTNTGTQLHTFTIPARQIDTGPLDPGDTMTVTIGAGVRATTQDFLCTFAGHAEAGMMGQLVVG